MTELVYPIQEAEHELPSYFNPELNAVRVMLMYQVAMLDYFFLKGLR